MSLVNEMLRDLDGRMAGAEQRQDGALEGLRPASGGAAPRDRSGLLLGLSVLLIACGVGLVGLAVWEHLREPEVAAAPEAKPAPQPSTAPAAGGAPPPAAEPPAPAAELALAPLEATPAPAPAALRGLQVEPREQGTRLTLELDRAVAHSVDTGPEGQRVYVSLPQTRLAQALPEALLRDPLVRSASSGVDSEGLYLLLDLERPAEVSASLVAGDGEGARLVLDLEARAGAAAPPVGPQAPVAKAEQPVAKAEPPAAKAEPPAAKAEPPPRKARRPVKRAARLTPRERAEQDYRAAMARVARGDLGGAQARLRAALAHAPGHLAAREALAGLALRGGRPGEARAVLAEGLGRAPGQPRLAMLYARLLVDGGDLERAVATLEAVPASGARDPELAAMLGALYQRQDRPAESAQQYAYALGLRHDRGAWWAGLGIALDALDRDEDARRAFAQAKDDPDLVPELRRYVTRRLVALAP